MRPAVPAQPPKAIRERGTMPDIDDIWGDDEDDELMRSQGLYRPRRSFSPPPACPDPQDDVSTLRAEISRLKEENGRLRDDVSGREPVATCEGCRAPMFEGDDFVSGEDCSGCWYTMTDAPTKRDRPCYAYRVGKCSAALSETGS